MVVVVLSFELQLEPTKRATSVRTIRVKMMRLVVQRFFIAVSVCSYLLFLFAKSEGFENHGCFTFDSEVVYRRQLRRKGC